MHVVVHLREDVLNAKHPPFVWKDAKRKLLTGRPYRIPGVQPALPVICLAKKLRRNENEYYGTCFTTGRRYAGFSRDFFLYVAFLSALGIIDSVWKNV